MAETVSDILGKGLKVENRVIIDALPPQKIVGTIPAFIGGAHWGEVNKPILIYKDFDKYMGSPVIAEDEADSRALDYSGLAAKYHLNYSQVCYYTRISDGTDTKASSFLRRTAKVAKFVGNGAIQNGVATIYPKTNQSLNFIQNNIFVIKKDSIIKTVEITPSTTVSQAVDISNVVVASLVNKNILFTIDDQLVIYKILGTELNLTEVLRNALATKFGISSTEADKYVFNLTIDNINLLDETFESGDVIVINDVFYSYDGTIWSLLVKTDGATTITPNPSDNAVFYVNSASVSSFDKAGNGGLGAFTSETYATGDFASRPVANQSGDYYYQTNNTPGLYYDDPSESDYVLLVAGTDYTAVAALPSIVAEGYYYNTVTEVLSFYDYDLNTVTTVSHEVLEYIIFSSQKYGKTSTIAIHDFPGTIYNESNTLNITGQDTPINGIVSSIDAEIKLNTTPGVPGDVGIYKKVTGAWVLQTGQVYGTIPAAPVSGNNWKSDGSNTTYPYGWYQYNGTAWVSLNFVEKESAKPLNTYGSDGDYFEVGGEVGIDDIVVGFDEFGRLMINSVEVGSAENITVLSLNGTYSIYNVFAIDSSKLNVLNVGIDEKLGGRIDAFYTGEEGNKIGYFAKEDQNGIVLQIFKGSDILGTFFDFSYIIADSNFIGTLINTDRVASTYVKLIPDSSVSDIPEFELNKTIYLSGGTSGVNNLQDFMYVAALKEYKNLDLYDVDIVSCPGLISETVVDAMLDVCSYRQDAFSILDTPQAMSPYLVERWHNGLSDLRTKKLDSEYGVLYYPWLLIKTDSAKLPNQWVPPSVRAVGAVSSCDMLNQNKYSVPAGHKNAALVEVEALERYLTEEEKQTLYADRLDNNINPIVYNKNNGYFIDGQKTTKKGATPLNRIKAVRTALFIKRRIYEIAPDFFWLPIDARTRASLAGSLKTIMDQLVADRVIKPNPVVIVDETLNNEYVEAEGGLIAKIEWYPVKSVEKIKIINVIRDQQVSVAIEI